MLIQASELVAKPGKSGLLRPTVTKMRDVLSETSGTAWTAWAAAAGRPYGTFGLTARRDDYAGLLGGLLQMSVAPAWAELAATADGLLANPAQTQLHEVITVSGEPTPPKQFTVVTSATLSGHQMAKATEWSLEMTEHVAKLTGQTTMLASAAAGSMFRIIWVSGADTPEGIDAANSAIAGDARYLELLSQAGAERFFIEGTTDRLLMAKLP